MPAARLTENAGEAQWALHALNARLKQDTKPAPSARVSRNQSGSRAARSGRFRIMPLHGLRITLRGIERDLDSMQSAKPQRYASQGFNSARSVGSGKSQTADNRNCFLLANAAQRAEKIGRL
jgi:hypothetical protein